MKLKYNVTPGNFVAVMMITLSVILKIDSNNPNDLIAAGYLLYTAIVMLLLDFFLQWIIIDNKRVWLIEGIALLILFSLSLFH
ncbi:hypothetical protein ACFOWM_06895 [Ferruginibacter yonginensis]|uniref:Uncharacterized protein n=1 Tax=Ferruginibacter yonginensis TaxID=1310416 RepID=A0ABV8QQP0_9BACT